MNLENSKVQVNIPGELASIIKGLDIGSSLDDHIMLMLAIALFEFRVISLARAAELSGRSLNDFIKMLTSAELPGASSLIKADFDRG